MEQKKCPFTSGTSRLPCLESECNLWTNEDCIFKGMAKNLNELVPEIQEIRRCVRML